MSFPHLVVLDGTNKPVITLPEGTSGALIIVLADGNRIAIADFFALEDPSLILRDPATGDYTELRLGEEGNIIGQQPRSLSELAEMFDASAAEIAELQGAQAAEATASGAAWTMNTGVAAASVGVLAAIGAAVSGSDSDTDTSTGTTDSTDTTDTTDTTSVPGREVTGTADNDTLSGGDGNDTLEGGAGADELNGGEGNDTASYANDRIGVIANLETGTGTSGQAEGDTFISIENLSGSDHVDVLTGDDAANELRGRAGVDRLNGGAGADVLDGGEGNDRLTGGAGADRLDGGSGVDTAVYSGSPTAVTVNLATGEGSGGEAEGDRLISIEELQGSDHNDRLTGDGGPNRLFGGAGDDRLDGGAGDDILFGHGGDDVFIGSASSDIFNGGDGVDTVSYSTSSEGVEVALGRPGLLGVGIGRAGDADGDNLRNIENLEGSNHNDSLTGNRLANLLVGLDGDDILVGNAGNDSLTGGAGADEFRFAPGAGSDIITDFAAGDRLVFAGGLFANLAAVQAAATETNGNVEIRLSETETLTLAGVSLDALNAETVITLDAEGTDTTSTPILPVDPSTNTGNEETEEDRDADGDGEADGSGSSGGTDTITPPMPPVDPNTNAGAEETEEDGDTDGDEEADGSGSSGGTDTITPPMPPVDPNTNAGAEEAEEDGDTDGDGEADGSGSPGGTDSSITADSDSPEIGTPQNSSVDEEGLSRPFSVSPISFVFAGGPDFNESPPVIAPALNESVLFFQAGGQNYILASNNNNFAQIIDANNLPTLKVLATITDGDMDANGAVFDTLNGATSIRAAEIADKLYALIASSEDNGVQIIDITDPASPLAVSSISDGGTDANGTVFDELEGAASIETAVIADKTYALIASGDDDGIQIVDITDPASPLAVSSISDGGTDTNQAVFDELDGAASIRTVVIADKTYALIASSEDDGVQIVDITDPASPLAVSSITDGDTDANGAAFDILGGASAVATAVLAGNTYALVASSEDNGVQIIDITDPASPAAVYSITAGESYSPLNGAFSITTAVILDRLYAFAAADARNDGVQFLRLSASGLPRAEAPGDLPGEAVTATGTLNINFGADNGNSAENGVLGQGGAVAGDRAVTFAANAIASLEAQNLTSGGAELNYRLEENSTRLLAYIGADTAAQTVFVADLADTGTGTYTFTLSRQLDHSTANEEDDLVLGFNFVATDADGDTASGSFSVTVDDDSPEIGASENSLVSLPDSATARGNLNIHFGVDDSNSAENGGLGQGGAVAGDRAVTFAANAIASLEAQNLTSDGAELNYRLEQNGTRLLAYIGADTAAQTVFVADLADTGTGTYTFTLSRELDQSTGNEDDDLVLGFNLVATDADGDTVSGSFSVRVEDVNDLPSGSVTISGTVSEGQTLTADISALRDADGLPADAAGYSYQWQRNTGANGDFENIADATARTYTLGDDDVDQTVRVQVSYTDGNGTDETVTSAVIERIETVGIQRTGGIGDDPLNGGAGADRLQGGDGTDTASYASSPAAVDVSLEDGSGTVGHAQGDTLIGIENIIGSGADDELWGDLNANRLEGGEGDDTLNGLPGNDRLIGGGGVDTFSGGVGDDILIGGDGNDNLRAGVGNDRLYGGAGDDILVFDVGEWNGDNDDERLADLINAIIAADAAGNSVIDRPGDRSTITFEGVGDDIALAEAEANATVIFDPDITI